MNTLTHEFRAEFGDESVFDGCDFRRHFDGWLYNAARLVSVSPTRAEQITKVWVYTREMAAWLLAHRARFQPGDCFQLIVAWPEQIRRTSRQIVKLGGDFDELAHLVSADEFTTYEVRLSHPVFRRGWDTGIYDSPSES